MISAANIAKLKQAITIPEYFRLYIDDRIDLIETPKILCPFHDDHKPSFTYSSEKGQARCWSCGKGGDLIAIHMHNYNLKSREDAVESLAVLLNLNLNEIDFSERKVYIDHAANELAVMTVAAEKVCKTPADWVHLDYIMSQRRPAFEMIEDLKTFIEVKGGIIYGEVTKRSRD